MGVILLMTARTHHRELDFVFYLGLMTCMTVDTVVFTVEWKIRLRIMVKLPGQPVIRPMAEFAFQPQPLFVHVIFLMARDAFNFGIFVGVRGVALFTGDKHVHAVQRKFSNVVVEDHLGFPAALVVAAFACFALLTPVRIVETMTGETHGADLFFEQ